MPLVTGTFAGARLTAEWRCKGAMACTRHRRRNSTSKTQSPFCKGIFAAGRRSVVVFRLVTVNVKYGFERLLQVCIVVLEYFFIVSVNCGGNPQVPDGQ